MDKAEESSTGNPRRFNGSTEQAHLPPQVASLIANRSTNHYQTAMEMGIGINPQIARLPKAQTNRSTRLRALIMATGHSADDETNRSTESPSHTLRSANPNQQINS